MAVWRMDGLDVMSGATIRDRYVGGGGVLYWDRYAPLAAAPGSLCGPGAQALLRRTTSTAPSATWPVKRSEALRKSRRRHR